MAYTVGSASVEIVPDFRQAQLKITKFFQDLPDKFTVPVRAEVDETQARAAGTRVGKAVEEGTAKARAAGDRAAVQAARTREMAVTRAHGEALRIQAQMDRDAAREAERTNRTLQQSITSAHAEALRMQAAMDKAAEQERLSSLRATMREVEQAAARELQMERDAQRERAALEERSARQTMKTVQALAAARAKAENDAAAEAARIRAQAFRDQDRQFQEQVKAEIRAYKAAIKNASREEKIRLQIEIDEREAMLAGRTAGGFYTRAIQREIKENGLVLATALGAAFIAGAPVAAAGATALFAGIGAAAAFQNNQLRQSWLGLWQDIKSQAVSDANVLVPAFDRMAGSIGQSFRRIRPDVQDTFTALVPQIDSFSVSVTRTAENALPGLTRAVQAGMPVTQGFGDLLERTGTGVSTFFDRITNHAPAAGAAFRELGSSFEAALPLLGELLGQGAETAAIVLPALTQALKGAHTVVDALGGALPSLLAGFLAFRLLQGTARFITGWSQSLGMASIQGGRFSSQLGRAAGTLSSVGKALPFVGVAVGALAAGMAHSSQKTQEWAQALNEGGAAAERVRRVMEEQSAAVEEANSGVSGFINALTGQAGVWAILGGEVKSANEAHQEYINNLNPLEAAQRDLGIATQKLADAQGDSGVSASELADLQGDVAEASARVAREQERLEMATRGVTEAMAEQADAARARVDMDFAYQQSVMDLAEAQNDLKKAMEGTYDTEAEKIAAVQQATLDLNKAMQDQVTAAADLATSNLPASMEDSQKKIIGAKAALDELNSLVAQGFTLPPSMEQYRQSLIGIVEGADGAMLAQAQLVEALAEVGIAAEAIPGTKVIQISAPTDEVKQRLMDLGFTVTEMPDGEIRVEAKTEQAVSNLDNLSGLLANVDATVVTPKATVDDRQLRNTLAGDTALLGVLGSLTPTPTAKLNDQPFRSIAGGVDSLIRNLASQNPTPTVSVNDRATGPLISIGGYLAGLKDRTVTITTRMQTVAGSSVRSTVGPKDGGAIENGFIAPYKKYDLGGAIIGPGGPRDDLIPAYGPEGRANYRISNGEHVLDALDVLLMGGQAGVYAFREKLNSRRFGSPGPDSAVRAMVDSAGAPTVAPVPSAPAGPPVHFYTPDYREAIRLYEQNRHREAVLSSPWRGR